jgi:hypothetical protein
MGRAVVKFGGARVTFDEVVARVQEGDRHDGIQDWRHQGGIVATFAQCAGGVGWVATIARQRRLV